MFNAVVFLLTRVFAVTSAYCDPCSCFLYRTPHTILCQSQVVFNFPQFIPQAVNNGILNITISHTSIGRLPAIQSETYPTLLSLEEINNSYLTCNVVMEWVQFLPLGCQVTSTACNLQQTTLHSTSVGGTSTEVTSQPSYSRTVVNPSRDYTDFNNVTGGTYFTNDLTSDLIEISTSPTGNGTSAEPGGSGVTPLLIGVIIPLILITIIVPAYCRWKGCRCRAVSQSRLAMTPELLENPGEVYEMERVGYVNRVYNPTTSL